MRKRRHEDDHHRHHDDFFSISIDRITRAQELFDGVFVMHID